MNKVSKSPWLLHYDASSCNGCDIEVLDCLTPKYDIERFGIINTGDPFQADILLITGGVNSQTESVVKQIYSQMPEPKVVVAVGICACTGGVFKECYNIKGGIDTVIPVDVYVPGCAARPESIIDGVVKALEILDAKQAAMELISIPELSSPSLELAYGLAGETAELNSDYDYSRSEQIIIRVPLEIDGREFAYAEAEYIGQELTRRGQLGGYIKGRW